MTPNRFAARLLVRVASLLLSTLAGLFWAAPALAQQDVVTVGTVNATGNTVDVPVYIRDVSGTPLGIDQPAGSRIESYSIKVSYAPAAAVQSVTFTRAGITASLTPTFESTPTSTGSITLIDAFSESTNLIPFNSNAASPGNLVAHLVFTLSSSAAVGNPIALTLDSSLTQLTDQGGDAATKETSPSTLKLVNGAINVAAPSVSLTPSPISVDLNDTTRVTVRLSSAVSSATSIALTSSNPSVATVPSSVTIAAGQLTAMFNVTAVAFGSTTITATLPPSLGSGTASAQASVVGPSLSFLPPAPQFTVGATGSITAQLSTAQTSATTVSLTSSDPTVLTVPASVVIPAGSSQASFTVMALKVGSATIQGQVASSAGGKTNTVFVQVGTDCVTPTVPQPAAPTVAASGTSYDITWPAISGASEYQIDESTSSTFDGATTRTVSTNSATYTHTAGTDVRYYYRVRARNHAGACDDTSASSSSISVLVQAAAVSVIPVVGSLPGAFGSFFRTSVQLYNATDAAISGRIVFHPSGATGTAADPTLAYTLGARKILAYDDLLPAMNQSGLGSADVVADGSTLPIAAIRVFNDAGVAGTSGLGESLLGPADALQQGDTGVLIAPTDFTKFRLNVGIRTLDLGATMSITVRDQNGNTTRSVTQSYGPTFFSQVAVAALLNQFTLTGGETISFTITSGSAIVYGSTTDNITNDPTYQLAVKAQ